MDYEQIVQLRDQHPAWRLLRAGNAALILSFLGRHYVEENNGATPASRLAAALDDELYSANSLSAEERYPKAAADYLDDWSTDGAGWLRRFYPQGSDEIHYDPTPAFEKAYAWATSLPSGAFVGTESRLQTVVELLRQIVHGTETDPETRLAELRRRRDDLDAQIAAAEAGHVELLDSTAVKERYQQVGQTARELLADFRQVEENFRTLDRSAREKIASWNGSKGELLGELLGDRTSIAGSDQGRSFQAFYDFLLSETRRDELAALVARTQQVSAVDVDRRLATIHHDWSDAAERTQRTVRQLSEQLRRFLDDQVWVENRRVLDLIREIESAALTCRESPPGLGLNLDVPGIELALPFERPLYDARPAAVVDSSLKLDTDAGSEADIDALLHQQVIDHAKLAANIRSLIPQRATAQLEDIVGLFPLQQGVAEVVAYLALDEDDIEVTMDETDETVIDYADDAGTRRVRLPRVSVTRR